MKKKVKLKSEELFVSFVNQETINKDKFKKLKINISVNKIIEELDLKISPLLLLGSLILFAFLTFWSFIVFFGSIFLGIIGFISGGLIFRNIYLSKKQQKEKLFSRQLPDALMAISNSLKAGFSLDQAFEFASKSLPEPTKTEFSKIHLNYRVGYSLQEALEGLTKRYNNAEVKLFVSSLVLQNQVGGNVIPFLGELSEIIRERQRLKEQIAVGTTQQKMSALIVTIIPYAILLLLLMSGYNALANTFRGGLILLFAMSMQGIGVLVMTLVTRIDV